MDASDGGLQCVDKGHEAGPGLVPDTALNSCHLPSWAGKFV